MLILNIFTLSKKLWFALRINCLTFKLHSFDYTILPLLYYYYMKIKVRITAKIKARNKC